jgi:type IV pilus biogenesis protein CpaD/CtpE
MLALTGCHVEQTANNPIEVITRHSFDFANWQQGDGLVETHVEPITLVHVLNYKPGDTMLSDEELGNLRNFLAASGGYDSARIEVDGPRISGGYFNALTKARLEDIRAELSGLGLQSQIPAQPMTMLAKPPEGIAVTVTRAMIIPPDCSAPQPEFAVRPDYVWSCVNAVNLGRMAADPVDLVHGRALPPADGEAAAKSIEAYRKGQVEEPKAEQTN